MILGMTRSPRRALQRRFQGSIAIAFAAVAFATGRLLDWCRANGYPAIAWGELTEVADWLTDALDDGRLPGRAEEVDGWREGRPPNEVTASTAAPTPEARSRTRPAS